MIHKGLYADGLIAIDKKQCSTEKKCILAEEIGHYYTSTGDILDQENVQNIKQEDRARGWAYVRVLDPAGFVLAHQAGCRSRFEIAEFLDVTEEFLNEAIKYFKRKYGFFHRVDEKYMVSFDPLGVFEMFNPID